MVIYREIQALRYDGKIRVLRAYIEPRRALRPSRATVRFETEPGRQLQHDWGEIIVPVAGRAQKVHIGVSDSNGTFLVAKDRFSPSHHLGEAVLA